MSVNILTRDGLVLAAGTPEVVTYSLSKNLNNEIVLTDSMGNTTKVTDENTKYSFDTSGTKLIVTGTDGSRKEITLGDTITDSAIISALGYTPADVNDLPVNLSDLSDDATHRLVTDAEKIDWYAKADISDIPTQLSELADDTTHRLVTDAEKTSWNSSESNAKGN